MPFQRRENNLKHVYLQTPNGIRGRVRLTPSDLARKEAEYQAPKAKIDALKRNSHEIARHARNQGAPGREHPGLYQFGLGAAALKVLKD